jgi:hypothetical protein
LSIFTNKIIGNFANSKSVRDFTSKLCTPSALLPVILLETSVITGRTYQAKKRGGDIEARERLTEESISAAGWLWGIGLTNKAFDFLINKIGKIQKKTGIKDFDFDTGNDLVRQPFEHVTQGLSESKKNFISILKFSKIIVSAAIPIGFMGFILPKINQRITKNKLDKKENQTGEPIQPIKIEHRRHRQTDLHEFLIASRGSKDTTKFNGGNFFEIAAHQLENNDIAHLLTIDTGLFTGRAVNARNEYERREILFRDITSTFFYIAATPLIYKGLCMLDSLKGKNTELSPDIVHDLHEKFTEIFGDKNSLSKSEFAEKIFGKRLPEISDNIFNEASSIFKDDIISVDKMCKFINENLKDTNLQNKLKKKALRLSELQPASTGKPILTKSQLTNLFHDGILNEPEIINELINNSTGKKAMNPIKFISQKKVDEQRKFINDYAQSVLEQAKKENLNTISTEFLQKMKTRNLITKLGYWGTGMVVSAYFLSTAIPKIQYWMTQKSTGHNNFPGIQKYEKIKPEKK